MHVAQIPKPVIWCALGVHALLPPRASAALLLRYCCFTDALLLLGVHYCLNQHATPNAIGIRGINVCHTLVTQDPLLSASVAHGVCAYAAERQTQRCRRNTKRACAHELFLRAYGVSALAMAALAMTAYVTHSAAFPESVPATRGRPEKALFET